MLYSVFKDIVASYLNRAAASVVTASATDLILTAMNDARRAAQREYTFEQASRQAFVQLSMIQKSMQTDFKDAPSGSNTVVVKRVDNLWEYSTTTISATTVYYPVKGIPFRRKLALKANVPFDPRENSLASPTLTDFVYIQGQSIAHTNLTTPTWVMADVIEFLTDHAGGSVEDIFLLYHTDWLKWATLANLNVWLKDTERTQVDQLLLQRTWDTVKQLDSQQANSTDNLDLE